MFLEDAPKATRASREIIGFLSQKDLVIDQPSLGGQSRSNVESVKKVSFSEIFLLFFFL